MIVDTCHYLITLWFSLLTMLINELTIYCAAVLCNNFVGKLVNITCDLCWLCCSNRSSCLTLDCDLTDRCQVDGAEAVLDVLMLFFPLMIILLLLLPNRIVVLRSYNWQIRFLWVLRIVRFFHPLTFTILLYYKVYNFDTMLTWWLDILFMSCYRLAHYAGSLWQKFGLRRRYKSFVELGLDQFRGWLGQRRKSALFLSNNSNVRATLLRPSLHSDLLAPIWSNDMEHGSVT